MLFTNSLDMEVEKRDETLIASTANELAINNIYFTFVGNNMFFFVVTEFSRNWN